jgi:hypothetical protein
MTLLSRGSASGSLTKTRSPAADLLRGQAQVFLLAPDIDRNDHRLAAVEHLARLAQHLGKQRDLERAAHIGEFNKGKTVAARGRALLAADDDAGEPEAGCAVAGERRRQVDPAQDPGAL